MTPNLCAPCLVTRMTWEAAHPAELKAALKQAEDAALAAMAAGRQLGETDIAAFLPPDLRPGQPGGMPPVQHAVTIVQGTLVCPGHIPGAPGQSRQLLVAQGALNPSMLAQPAA